MAQKISRNLLLAIFPLYMLNAFLAMIGYKFILLSILFYLFLIIIGLNNFFNIFKQPHEKSNKKFILLVLFYIIYNVLSVVWYVFHAIPISTYFLDLRDEVLPIFFIFVGMNYKFDGNKFYNWFLYSSAFCFLIGLYLYIVSPDWYITWKIDTLSDSWVSENNQAINIDYILSKVHLTSYFLSSYQVSNYGALAIIILSGLFLKNIKSKFYSFLFYVSIITIIASQGRSAIVYSVIVIVACSLYDRLHLKNLSSKVTKIIIFSMFAFFILEITNNRIIQVVETIGSRFLTISIEGSLLNERTDFSIFEGWGNYLFGTGLGSGGHKAFKLGFSPTAIDASYFKLFIEKGIIGLILFFTIIFSTLLRGIRRVRYFLTELLIVGYFLVAFIGANLISMPHIIIFLWFSLGIIWNNNYIQACKKSDYLVK